MMKNKIWATLCIVFCSLAVNAQNEEDFRFERWDLSSGMGIGNKSHYGIFGLNGNLYLGKHLSLKLAGGVGAFNYNGLVGSVGLEAPVLYVKNSFLSIGSAWTYLGEGFDVLGDDDSDDYVTYNTARMRNLKFYVGYSFQLEPGINLSTEVGYSYALTSASYYFGGPGVPNQNQIDKLERGLNSGWMASIYIQFLWNENPNRKKK